MGHPADQPPIVCGLLDREERARMYSKRWFTWRDIYDNTDRA